MNTIIHHVQCDAIGKTFWLILKLLFIRAVGLDQIIWLDCVFFLQGTPVLNLNLPTKLCLTGNVTLKEIDTVQSITTHDTFLLFRYYRDKVLGNRKTKK